MVHISEPMEQHNRSGSRSNPCRFDDWPDDEFTDQNFEVEMNDDALPPPPPEDMSLEITEFDYKAEQQCTRVSIDEDTCSDIERPHTGTNDETVQNNRCTTTKSCFRHPRIIELYTSADYWSVWYGLILFGMTNGLVFIVIPHTTKNDSSDSNRIKYVIPQPMMWTNNPFDAWDVYGIFGTILLLTALGVLYIIALKCMGKLKPSKIVPIEKKLQSVSQAKTIIPRSVTVKYIYGYIFMCMLSTLSLWIGSNYWCSSNGLGYAVFAIFFGVVVTNTPKFGNYIMDNYIGLAATDGEFFIKCSLVLLAVQFNELVDVGIPGMVVAWVGSPLSIIFGFLIGTRLMHCDATVVILIAVGASWCGASAISAVAPIIAASSEQVSLAVSVVSFFTLGFTFIQPYIAIGVGMPDDIAGAWIGGSIDQTGNVVVSAAIISEEALQVASIVKMVLNAALGVMASIIACWWYSRKSLPYDEIQNEDNDGTNRKTFNLITLWDKFPKFTIGFIITSAVLTATIQRIEGTSEADALPIAIASMNRWLFAISFVGIGLTTNIAKLWDKATKSGIIPVYIVVNFLDVVIALGLAYLVY